MVPSGLYRYFENRDALLTALIIGAYDALGEQTEQAVKNTPKGDHRGRWRAVCRAVRDWAVAHPQEFTLIYGSPITDYRAPTNTVAPAAHVYTLLLQIVNDCARSGELILSATEPHLTRNVAQDATKLLSELNTPELTPATLMRALTAWSQVVGIISQELFGHLEGVFSNYAEVVDQRVELMEDMGGLPSHP